MSPAPHEFRREYLLRLPLPLAQLYSRAFNAKDARSRHDNAFYLCESAVKLATAATVACYLHEVQRGAERSPILDRQLAALALPSLGQWLAMLRETAKYFDRRVDGGSHALGGLFRRLDDSRNDRPALLALYRRIKNGPDGAPAGDQSCSLLQVLDGLVQYRNGVFGHGGARFDSFFEQEMGPLLLPALNELLADGVWEPLGPVAGRLAYITELRTLDDGRIQAGLRELVGLEGERMAPLEFTADAARELLPNRVVAVWPGRAVPLRLDPLIHYRESDLAEEVLFLNRDRNAKQVEYLSYTTGRTERDKSTAPAMAALLSLVANREVSETELERFAEQSLVETPSVESLFQPAALAGLRVGDYELLAELGRGGMGVVYLAKQLSLGRLVALKTLPADLADDEVSLARFRREIRHLARCDHPNIVKVLGSGTLPDGRLYYAMEYVPGSDLEQVWRELTGDTQSGGSTTLGNSTWARAVLSASRKRRAKTESSSGAVRRDSPGAASPPPLPTVANALPPLPELPAASDDPGDYVRRVTTLIRDAALALEAVHAQGVVHRDVKPANLMLTPDGSRVVLMDFGLAKGQTAALTAVSQGGGFLGTLRYSAPEQLAAAKLQIGVQADVRALGVTLWEMLTRRRLFAEADDEASLAERVLHDNVPPLRTIDLGFDRDLEAIVARACERRQSDRIESAGKLAEYLQLWLDRKPLPIRTPGLGELAKRWVREHKSQAATVGIGTVLVLAVTAAAFALINRARQEAVVAKDDAQRLTAEKSNLAEANSELAASEALQRTMAEKETARLRTERGLAMCEQGAGHRGLLWLAHSLRPAISSGSTDIETVARANLESWSRELPTLLTTIIHPTRYNADMLLSDDGRFLATKADDGVRFWNAISGESIGDAILDSTINSVVFSPDSRIALICSRVDGVRVYDAATAKRLGAPLHAAGVRSAVFSPDGRILVTLGTDKSIYRWDTNSRKEIFPCLTLDAEPIAAAFSRDGKTLVVTSEDSQVGFWEIKTWKQIQNLRVNSDAGFPYFNDDGTRLFIAAREFFSDPPQLWDCQTGKLIASFQQNYAKGMQLPTHQLEPEIAKTLAEAQKIAYSDVKRYAPCPDKKTIAVVRGYDDEVALIEMATGKTVGSPWKLQHDNFVNDIAVSPDQLTLASCSDDRTVRLWKFATGESLDPPLEHPEKVKRVAFSPDGLTVYTLTEDGTVRRWRAFPETPRAVHFGYVGTPRVTYSTDGKNLLLSTIFGAQLHDAETYAELEEFVQLGNCLVSAVSPNGKWFAAGSAFAQLRLWQRGSNPPLSLTGQKGSIQVLAFSPDERWLISGGEGGVWIWDITMEEPVGRRLEEVDGWVMAAAFDRSGKRLLLGTSSSHAQMWDVTSWRPIGSPLKMDGFVNAVAFSPDDRLILLTGGNLAQVWNSETREHVGPPLTHQAEVTGARFSPDGNYVITQSDDNTAQLWETKSGRAHHRPFHHHSPVTATGFTPDGRVAITGSKEGIVRMWDTATCLPVSPPYQFKGAVRDLAVHPSGKVISIACGNEESIWFCKIPHTASGVVEQIIGWTEAMTCLALDPVENKVRNLATTAWSDRMRLFNDGGESPVVTTPEYEREFAWHSALAQTSTLKGDSFAALWHLDALLTDHPENHKYLSLRSLAHSRLHNWESCIVDCTRCLKKCPESSELLARRGGAYLRLQRYDEALDDYVAANRLAPHEGDTLGRIGYLHLAKGQHQAAIDKYTEAIAIQSDKSWYWTERGDCQGWLKRWPEAIKDYTEAIRLSETDETIWLRRGNAYIAIEQWDKALFDYNTLVNLNPNSAQYHERRAAAYSELGRRADAIADLSESVRLSPGEASYWNTRGDQYFAQSDWERALVDYSEAIKLDPKSVVYRRNRAFTYGWLAKNDEAIADLNECIQLAPENAALWNHRGNRFFRVEAWEKSLTDYERAVALDSKNPVYLRNLADVLIKVGRIPEAKIQLEASTAAAPDDAESWNAAGISSVRIDDLDSARSYFERASELDSKSAVFLRNLAAVQAQQQDWEKAYRNYHRLLSRSGVTAAFIGEAALLAKKLDERETYAERQADARKLLTEATEFAVQQPLIWICQRFGNELDGTLSADQLLTMLDVKDVDERLALLTRGTVCFRHARFDEATKLFSMLLQNEDSKKDPRVLALYAMSQAAQGDKTSATESIGKARSISHKQGVETRAGQVNCQLTWQTDLEVELLLTEASEMIGENGSLSPPKR
jgi:WD40 repeat protein/tetratricopeptide (TPR) repeat protein